MRENITTRLHYRRFDFDKPGEQQAYDELVEHLKAQGLKPFTDSMGLYPPASQTHRAYEASIKALNGQQVTLEAEHLFSNQWNCAEGVRLHNWYEWEWPNPRIKTMYWLEQVPEMAAILRNNAKCGYCGHIEATGTHEFCPKCMGSPYLGQEQLHLRRMKPINFEGNRKPLTKAELAAQLPLYVEAQTKRSAELQKKKRADVEADYKKAIAKAETEYYGYCWLLDHGLNVENCIFYSHTQTFCFGWREPISADVVVELEKLLAEFPYKWEIKKGK